MEGYDWGLQGNLWGMIEYRKVSIISLLNPYHADPQTFGSYYPELDDWQPTAAWQVSESYRKVLMSVCHRTSSIHWRNFRRILGCLAQRPIRLPEITHDQLRHLHSHRLHLLLCHE